MVLIPIAKFSAELDLSAMAAMLARDGVTHRITEADGYQVLCVEENVDVDRVEAIIREFSELAKPATASDLENPYSLPSYKTVLRSFWRAFWYFPVTTSLLAIAIISYILQAWVIPPGLAVWFHFVPISNMMESGHIWRLVTPIFIHYGILHILFNCLWIWDLGKRIERYVPTWKYALLILITALTGNLLQYLVVKKLLFGGLSGVVYGFFGFLWVANQYKIVELFIPKALFVFMLTFLALGYTGLLEFVFGIGLANWAHLGGLVGGLLYGVLILRRGEHKNE